MEAGLFVTVARVDDVPPGTVLAVRAGEEEIALAHIDGGVYVAEGSSLHIISPHCDGGFYATQGHCLHLKGPLGDGALKEGVCPCPWRGWQYDVHTGENEFDR